MLEVSCGENLWQCSWLVIQGLHVLLFNHSTQLYHFHFSFVFCLFIQLFSFSFSFNFYTFVHIVFGWNHIWKLVTIVHSYWIIEATLTRKAYNGNELIFRENRIINHWLKKKKKGKKLFIFDLLSFLCFVAVVSKLRGN